MSKDRNSLLWEIRSGNEKSYLFGTVHVPEKKALDKARSASEYIRRSDIFFAETDLSDISELQAYDIQLPNGQSLKSHYGAKRFTRMKSLFEKRCGFNLDAYNNIRPILTINALAESIMELDSFRPVDHYLWDIAESLNLKLGGIEKLEEQLGILKSLPLQHQYRSLHRISTNFQRFRKDIASLASLYAEEDIHRIYQRSSAKLGLSRKLMVKERNFRMAARIEKLV